MNQLDEDDFITLRFLTYKNRNEKLPKACEVSKFTSIKTIKQSYAKATNVCPKLLKFDYNSENLDDEETPDILGMRNLDFIWVYFPKGNV